MIRSECRAGPSRSTSLGTPRRQPVSKWPEPARLGVHLNQSPALAMAHLTADDARDHSRGGRGMSRLKRQQLVSLLWISLMASLAVSRAAEPVSEAERTNALRELNERG